jgi:hypothetical protein
MAVTFPMSQASFFSKLLIKTLKFDHPENVEMNTTGGGELLRADLAPMLWAGEVKFGNMTRTEAANAQALLDMLRGSGRSFYAYDTRRPAPLFDPTGSTLGAATVTINSLIAGGRELKLQGLPAGYKLSCGDYLAFDYGTTPVRRALHRVFSSSVTAAGTGITPNIEVTPPIRAGAAVGATVTLIKAACKAVIVPNSIDTGTTARSMNDGMSFKFQQSLG